jgi:hypothetical protein
MVSVALRALLLAVAAAVMTGDAQAILVLVLVGVEAGLARVFRQVQAALLPWLARTPDELTHANTAVGVMLPPRRSPAGPSACLRSLSPLISSLWAQPASAGSPRSSAREASSPVPPRP